MGPRTPAARRAWMRSADLVLNERVNDRVQARQRVRSRRRRRSRDACDRWCRRPRRRRGRRRSTMLLPADRSGPVGVVPDLIGVDHLGAELGKEPRRRALAGADSAGDPDCLHDGGPPSARQLHDGNRQQPARRSAHAGRSTGGRGRRHACRTDRAQPTARRLGWSDFSSGRVGRTPEARDRQLSKPRRRYSGLISSVSQMFS